MNTFETINPLPQGGGRGRARWNALREAGITLPEMLVAMFIFSIIAIAVTSFLVDSSRINFHVEAQTDMGIVSQGALDEIRWKLEQSRRILDVDSGFLPLVDLNGAPDPAGEIRLPRIEPNGSLTPRAGGNDAVFNKASVGNALLFVEALPPYREPKSRRLIDIYRFVLYYVAKKTDGGKIGTMPYYLDVIRVESVVYADFQQVDSLRSTADTLEIDVVTGLMARGITVVWDAGSPPDAAFSRLADGRLLRTPEPRHLIKPASIKPAIPGMGHGQRISGNIGYTVAPNNGVLPIKQQVPKFGQIADGFPNGFEVLITGPGHGRKVMIRLVLAAQTQGRFFSREHQMIAAVWDG